MSGIGSAGEVTYDVASGDVSYNGTYSYQESSIINSYINQVKQWCDHINQTDTYEVQTIELLQVIRK